MKSSVVIIFNPTARTASAKGIEYASSFLRQKGFSPEIFVTEKRGDAERIAGEAAGRAPRMIIAAGGDGTINEVANGMAGSGVPLAVLPLGTTNVLAKELCLPVDLHDALEVAVSREPRTVSLGRIEWETFSRYFCLMAGIGVDGRAVRDIDASFKKLSGRAAYILSGVRNFLRYTPDDILVRVEGNEYPCSTVIAGKSSKYGGNFRVTPDASLLEPSLYLCIFRGRGRGDLLKYVFGIVTGSHLGYKDVTYLKATNVEIRGKAHIQIDGDYLGIAPAKISVAKDVLRIIW